MGIPPQFPPPDRPELDDFTGQDSGGSEFLHAEPLPRELIQRDLFRAEAFAANDRHRFLRRLGWLLVAGFASFALVSWMLVRSTRMLEFGLRAATLFFSWGFLFGEPMELMRQRFHRRSSGGGAVSVIAAIVAGVILLFFAFATRGAQTAPTPAQPNGESAKTAAPLIVKDDKGRQVEVPQPLKRIISLAPSVTETIFALGAQDRLVADTDDCSYPPAAQK